MSATTTTTAGTTEATTDGSPSRWRWLAFAVAIAASVMDLLDGTITQVAGPAIRRDLGGSYTLIQWVTASYTLAMAAGLLTGGRLGDLYGRKRVLLIGIAGFVTASAGAAVASTPGELIAARVLQGAAGAMMLPQVFGLLRDLFDDREMPKALGIFGSAMGLSAMLGPIFGGGIIGLDLFSTSWRMIFLVNLPFGIAALVIGAKLLPPATAQTARARLDVVGVVLAGVAMLLLVFPLVEGHDLGWPTWLVGLLVASIPVLGLFVRHQQRRQRAGRSPLIELSIFKRPAYASGVVFSLVFVASLGGIVLIFNVFLQAGLGFTPWHAALATAPWSAGAFVGSGIGSAAMRKVGRKVIQAGLALEAVGLLGLYGVLEAVGADAHSLELLAPMIVGGLGMGMVFVPLFDIVLAGVEPYQLGSASGVLQTVNSLGMSLGVAALGAIFFGVVGAVGVGSKHQFVTAAELTALVTVALLMLAFVLGFKLPRGVRETSSEATKDESAPSAIAVEPGLLAA